ncbi:VTT domain-containing protein [Sporolactobacillus sp. CQH2019]|uniref:VTT domain-containing protein n=1 Tax=Sporolactobacillus sp. CQH2019 TaxID=3023512 RepID=UPI0023675E6B|nr:VTT domain-containing protein [Sporolactobacillus sp. CQH2019]MDD9147525.1 VTT domain-containing protein [Sporolactobacillus sp. CQH2019]
MSGLIHLLNEYGYLTLFLSLMFELILIPIPNEALMSYVGILSFQGKMNIVLSYLSAGIGGIFGVTISYWIGYKLGLPFFRKFGRYIHMGPEKLEKVSKWYDKYGKVLLIFSYFVPGIRHIASITSGVIRLPFRSFWIFSYIGVFLWTGTFISLGYVLGPEWDKYQGEIKKWLVLASILIGILVLCYFVIRANRRFIKESGRLLFQSVFKRYRSFLKIKLFIFLILILFVSLFTLMLGMIQDFVSNEFEPFNTVSRAIIFSLFSARWQTIMNDFYALSSQTALIVVFLITAVTIFINRTNKWLELLFFAITAVGSFLFSGGIRWLFRFMLSGKYISSNFPDWRAMILIVFYGFFLMMLIRHQRSYLFGTILFFLYLFFLLVYSISGVYVYHVNPSDLMAGYVFGAVWLSGMIFSLELFRFLSLIKEGSK